MEEQHKDIRELIPWYINGTLDERDMDQVSTHVSQCSDCALEVEREVRLAKRMRIEPPGLESMLEQQQSALQSLQARLAPTTSKQTEGLAIRRWSALAATFVMVATVSFFAGRATNDSTYELMASQTSFSGPVIQLIFNPHTSEQDIRGILNDSGGTLLGSPSPKGVYRIGLPTTVDARAYASRLAQHPIVRWSEAEL